MKFAELAPMMAAGADLNALVEALGRMTSDERHALSAPVTKAGTRYQSPQSDHFVIGGARPTVPASEIITLLERGARYDPRVDERALMLVTMACVDDIRIAVEDVGGARLEPDQEHLAVTVLRDRNPAWLDRLPQVLLTLHQNRGWWLTSRLVSAGMTSAPPDRIYHLGVIDGIVSYRFDGPSVLERLVAQPPFLESDVWPMLGCEGAGRALKMVDRIMPGRGWLPALTSLTQEGVLDRERLLDVGFAAALSGWRPVDVTWYLDLVQALQVDIESVAARQRDYVQMLTSAVGPAVSLAQQQLSRLQKFGLLDAERFVATSAAVLVRPEKARVLAHFKLLTAVRDAHPELTAAVSSVAATALHHQHPEVRDRAARLHVSA